MTNSSTSNYWDRLPNKPIGRVTRCLIAFVDGRWVEGCGYATASEGSKTTVASLLKSEPNADGKGDRP
jgi:hypothetical protein